MWNVQLTFIKKWWTTYLMCKETSENNCPYSSLREHHLPSSCLTSVTNQWSRLPFLPNLKWASSRRPESKRSWSCGVRLVRPHPWTIIYFFCNLFSVQILKRWETIRVERLILHKCNFRHRILSAVARQGQLPSQQVPRHMRRRAVSHNPNRLPRRLRRSHIAIRHCSSSTTYFCS